MVKKALLIGINYRSSNAELKGCINDVNNIYQVITTKYGYSDVRILTDDTPTKPTKAAIVDGFNWLLSGLTPGSTIYFHYSGHGVQVPDKDGDEVDGLDECLVPIDYKTTGLILDDYVRANLVMRVPKDVKLMATIDACHSQSAFDLLWNLTIDSQNKISLQKIGRYPETAGTVIQLSGCQDNQTSADAFIGGLSQGAMSFLLLQILKNHQYSITLASLMIELRKTMPSISGQVPCLSFGKYLDLSALFSF